MTGANTGFTHGGPGPKEVNNFHGQSDVDTGDKAQHHTLGWLINQAAPGFLTAKRLKALEDYIDAVDSGASDLIADVGTLQTQMTTVSGTLTSIAATYNNYFGWHNFPSLESGVSNHGSGFAPAQYNYMYNHKIVALRGVIEVPSIGSSTLTQIGSIPISSSDNTYVIRKPIFALDCTPAALQVDSSGDVSIICDTALSSGDTVNLDCMFVLP